MTGLYSQFQQRYADLGVTVFPCATSGTKKPLVGNYLKMGPRAAAELAKKFPDANGIGFAAGPRNRITVLDARLQECPGAGSPGLGQVSRAWAPAMPRFTFGEIVISGLQFR
jgi:hypothetical protein